MVYTARATKTRRLSRVYICDEQQTGVITKTSWTVYTRKTHNGHLGTAGYRKLDLKTKSVVRVSVTRDKSKSAFETRRQVRLEKDQGRSQRLCAKYGRASVCSTSNPGAGGRIRGNWVKVGQLARTQKWSGIRRDAAWS